MACFSIKSEDRVCDKVSEDFSSLKVAYEAQQGGAMWGRCWQRGISGRKVVACESSDAALNRLSTWLEVLILLSLLDHHYIDSGAQSAGMPTEAHRLRDCLEEKSCCVKERSDIKKITRFTTWLVPAFLKALDSL